jgi:anti-sigma factor RsiW
MTDNEAIHDDELHAFVDGQLEPARLPALLAWLQAHPEAAARVAAWQAQRLALRRLHRGLDVGETPEALARTVRPRRPAPWQRGAAAAALLAAGLGAGLLAARWGGSDAPAVAAGPTFARDAAIAHAVYTPETRHPVEVGAAEEAHLVQWLGRRLGTPLKAPLLHPQGFRLLGGRLLPGPGSPRAQFMYEDAQGRRVTLYLTVFGADDTPRETAFRSVRSGEVESFYWIEGRFGYAVSGELPPADLMALAREAYRQLAR